MAKEIEWLRTQQGIDKSLRLIQDFVVIGWIVRLWTKHRPLAVRCVYGRTPPTGVAPDVDAIPSVVMSLISHAISSHRATLNAVSPLGRARPVTLPSGPQSLGDRPSSL